MVVNRKRLADSEWVEWTTRETEVPIAPYDKGEVFMRDRPDDNLCLFAGCEMGELQLTLISKGPGFENRITFPLNKTDMEAFGRYVASCYVNHQSDYAEQVEEEGVREMEAMMDAVRKGEDI